MSTAENLATKADLKAEIATLRADLKGDNATARADMLRWIVSAIAINVVAQAGGTIAILMIQR